MLLQENVVLSGEAGVAGTLWDAVISQRRRNIHHGISGPVIAAPTRCCPSADGVRNRGLRRQLHMTAVQSAAHIVVTRGRACHRRRQCVLLTQFIYLLLKMQLRLYLLRAEVCSGSRRDRGLPVPKYDRGGQFFEKLPVQVRRGRGRGDVRRCQGQIWRQAPSLLVQHCVFVIKLKGVFLRHISNRAFSVKFMENTAWSSTLRL